MPCFRPIKGYRSATVNRKTGKRSIVFKPKEGFVDMPIDLPCGKCISCRLKKSRDWATRCVHEASLYEDNCFITLTYNKEHLPKDLSLNKKHFQDFMKRLRKRFGAGVRYFHCGEYGEKNARPHYHACLFNFDFKDKILFKQSGGNPLYISKALSELWPFGFSTIGNVTFDSAAYVARYVTKKITGDKAVRHYNGRLPEYATMSRRSGLGAVWFAKYYSDIYPSDFVVVSGKRLKPPKYYDGLFEKMFPDRFLDVKRNRKMQAKKHPVDESRLGTCEEYQKKKMDFYSKRTYEHEMDYHSYESLIA